MKQFVAGILAIIYLFTTTGFTTDTHYCMGKISSVQIAFAITSNSCNDQSHGCCRDEFKVYKLNIAHKQALPVSIKFVCNPLPASVSAHTDFSKQVFQKALFKQNNFVLTKINFQRSPVLRI
jgi:hypothetical protein